MAKLVAVSRSDDYPFERRQIPLIVDDNLTMVIQFSDSCIACEQGSIKAKDIERFMHKFKALSNDEIAKALMVTNKQIFNLLAQMVPCVGCRRSVERLFNQLVESGHPALEPLVTGVTSHGSYLSIKQDYLSDAKSLYLLFYVHGSRLNVMMESIPKSKKNKRCMLHSLDTHKVKSLGAVDRSWMDIWEVLAQECREEVILVECDSLMETLENYLRKHRFCSECKSKVLRAYSILVGELDSNTEKGYCPALYEGLRCCPGEKHIHVLCETDFIAHLIGRAEPELTGSRRERHAKTLDIAQEEVLTCLGIYLYERLHRIWQKLRAEEQTWQILFYLGVDSLKKSFEMALERKQGISNLELMCLELAEEEQAKEARREQKRQKRKKKKGTKVNNNNNVIPDDVDCHELQDKENCKCDDNLPTQTSPSPQSSCASCEEQQQNSISVEESCQSCGETTSGQQSCRCGEETTAGGREGTGNRSDCGYSSGHEGCESCGVPSSRDSSDVACSEGMCNHDGDSPLCNRVDLPDVWRDCGSPAHAHNHSPIHNWHGKCDNSEQRHEVESPVINGSSKYNTTLSLQDMLEQASCSSGEEDDFISEEEIERFRANQKVLNTKRQELRETLRVRFANMQQRCHIVSPHVVSPPVSRTGVVDKAAAAHITKLSMN